MYKVNNSFQFFESYFSYTYTNTGNINYDFRNYIVVNVPRQVDMETGEIYYHATKESTFLKAL